MKWPISKICTHEKSWLKLGKSRLEFVVSVVVLHTTDTGAQSRPDSRVAEEPPTLGWSRLVRPVIVPFYGVWCRTSIVWQKLAAKGLNFAANEDGPKEDNRRTRGTRDDYQAPIVRKSAIRRTYFSCVSVWCYFLIVCGIQHHWLSRPLPPFKPSTCLLPVVQLVAYPDERWEILIVQSEERRR